MGCGCAINNKDYSLLEFPNGSKVGIFGLDDIMAELFAEGKKPNDETAEEIVERLSEKNYIAPSARKEYEKAVLLEYLKYCNIKNDKIE